MNTNRKKLGIAFLSLQLIPTLAFGGAAEDILQILNSIPKITTEEQFHAQTDSLGDWLEKHCKTSSGTKCNTTNSALFSAATTELKELAEKFHRTDLHELVEQYERIAAGPPPAPSAPGPSLKVRKPQSMTAEEIGKFFLDLTVNTGEDKPVVSFKALIPEKCESFFTVISHNNDEKHSSCPSAVGFEIIDNGEALSCLQEIWGENGEKKSCKDISCKEISYQFEFNEADRDVKLFIENPDKISDNKNECVSFPNHDGLKFKTAATKQSEKEAEKEAKKLETIKQHKNVLEDCLKSGTDLEKGLDANNQLLVLKAIEKSTHEKNEGELNSKNFKKLLEGVRTSSEDALPGLVRQIQSWAKDHPNDAPAAIEALKTIIHKLGSRNQVSDWDEVKNTIETALTLKMKASQRDAFRRDLEEAKVRRLTAVITNSGSRETAWEIQSEISNLIKETRQRATDLRRNRSASPEDKEHAYRLMLDASSLNMLLRKTIAEKDAEEQQLRANLFQLQQGQGTPNQYPQANPMGGSPFSISPGGMPPNQFGGMNQFGYQQPMFPNQFGGMNQFGFQQPMLTSGPFGGYHY